MALIGARGHDLAEEIVDAVLSSAVGICKFSGLGLVESVVVCAEYNGGWNTSLDRIAIGLCSTSKFLSKLPTPTLISTNLLLISDALLRCRALFSLRQSDQRLAPATSSTCWWLALAWLNTCYRPTRASAFLSYRPL